MSQYNPQHVTAPCDEPAELSDEQRTAARRIVAGNAVDAQDATALMLMLGIYPGQESEEFNLTLPQCALNRSSYTVRR